MVFPTALGEMHYVCLYHEIRCPYATVSVVPNHVRCPIVINEVLWKAFYMHF